MVCDVECCIRCKDNDAGQRKIEERWKVEGEEKPYDDEGERYGDEFGESGHQ